MSPLTRAVLVCVLLNVVVAAEDPACLGSWQETTQAGDLILFERDRCAFKDPREAQPQFGCAAYSPAGDVWVRCGGARLHLRVKVEGDRLEIVSGGKGTYRRLAAVPPALQLVPLAIPAAKPVSAERTKAIAAEAAKRLKEDQAVRTDRSRGAEMGKVDAGNTAWIRTIIAEIGWPDAGRFGKQTASSMFLFVQHSGDLPLMLGVLPCIEADVRAKAADPQDYALLFDRVQMNSGRPQRYGSQIVPDNGKQVVFLLEDKTKVEQLRAAIGLFPLKTYLQMFEQQGGKVGFMEQVRFDD